MFLQLLVVSWLCCTVFAGCSQAGCPSMRRILTYCDVSTELCSQSPLPNPGHPPHPLNVDIVFVVHGCVLGDNIRIILEQLDSFLQLIEEDARHMAWFPVFSVIQVPNGNSQSPLLWQGLSSSAHLTLQTLNGVLSSSSSCLIEQVFKIFLL
jgi:hypothetical protein